MAADRKPATVAADRKPATVAADRKAGLDGENEERVLGTLRARAAAGQVVIIAAHHPQVIAAADNVVRLGSGGRSGAEPGRACDQPHVPEEVPA